MKQALLLLLFFLTACRPSPVNVVVALPENGSMASLRNGIELAADRINAEGGIYGHIIKVVPAEAGSRNIDLKEASVVVLATGDGKTLSSISRTAGTAQVPVILVNPLADEAGQENGVVRFARSARDEAFFLGDFCAFSLHASKVLVLKDDEELAAAFKQGFSRDKRLAVDYSVAAEDPESDALKIKKVLEWADPPQAVFWASEKELPEAVLKMLNDELKGRALFVPAASVLNASRPFPAATLTAIPYFDGGKRNIGVVEFAVNYKNSRGSAPSSWSAIGYETMTAVKESFESGAKKAGEMREFMKNREMNFVLLGKLNFNAECELVIPFDMAMIRKKGVVPVRELDRKALVDLQEKVLAFRYGQKNGKTADSE